MLGVVQFSLVSEYLSCFYVSNVTTLIINYPIAL